MLSLLRFIVSLQDAGLDRRVKMRRVQRGSRRSYAYHGAGVCSLPHTYLEGGIQVSTPGIKPLRPSR
jgi:hypothetical protein